MEGKTKTNSVFQLSEGKNISLSKMRCKDYYSLFRSNLKDEPTLVKTWARYYPPFANKWEEFFKDVFKTVFLQTTSSNFSN